MNKYLNIMSKSLKLHEQQHLIKVKQDGTTYDRIWAYMAYGESHIILSSAELEIKKRWEAAFSLLVNYHSTEQAVPLLIESQKISRAQAYRDIRDAKNLFGDVTKSSKSADRYILGELAMKTFQVAAKSHDVDGMNRAISNLIKIKGLDRPDDVSINPEDIESHSYYIVIGSGDDKIKLDLSAMNDVPETQRTALAKFLNESIAIEDAQVIMES